jgi:protocatechuate 3,4-dioxygenase alpha subunit
VRPTPTGSSSAALRLPTPSQTVGPFFGYALPFGGGTDVVAPWTADAITLHGVVLDGDGTPVPDALIETWQHAPDGTAPRDHGSLHRRPDRFTGFGRTPTDADGAWWLHTLRPGPVHGHAPHLALVVFARGLLTHLHTRLYLPEDVSPDDRLLAALGPDRASTLVARPDGERRYRFDIRLQGEGETVFLDLTTTGAAP